MVAQNTSYFGGDSTGRSKIGNGLVTSVVLDGSAVNLSGGGETSAMLGRCKIIYLKIKLLHP
jgi:hypothetical protein